MSSPVLKKERDTVVDTAVDLEAKAVTDAAVVQRGCGSSESNHCFGSGAEGGKGIGTMEMCVVLERKCVKNMNVMEGK